MGRLGAQLQGLMAKHVIIDIKGFALSFSFPPAIIDAILITSASPSHH
jgi:hypothetical protein